MAPRILRSSITKEDDAWVFTIPPKELQRGALGKLIRFSGTEIIFELTKFSNNRILQTDDRSKFVQVSFALPWYPHWTAKDGADYISRFFQRGLFINGVQYRFYHHSPSQLRGRSCYMRQADTDQELDARIYKMGSFGNIMNVAKRAKRIGLLYSEAQLDFILPPQYTQDIPDIQSGDEIFSDGCGLMSRHLAVQVSKSKKIIFRGERYTPSVYQIRYLGYKGVLMLHPEMDRKNEADRRAWAAAQSHPSDASPPASCFAQFRRSMKKFNTTDNPTFSVVGYSKPYAFGRLNNEFIILLSSLGVPDENFVKCQQEYFDSIAQAEHDPMAAIDFLSSTDNLEAAEKVLLEGIQEPSVVLSIRAAQRKEVASFQKEGGRDRSRIIVKKSRKMFGVCDPFRVLKEGEVHVRITESRGRPSTLIHGSVLVVRNPCLHPGDCLKLRAVQHPALVHLVDCIVFASVARPGHHSAPSMSSGGDLDGDEYFVCWDPGLVPSTIHEAYDYPPNKERVNKSVTRMDLANYFAAYNSGGLARVARLHKQWASASPKGALCSECQELSALHSQSVDGAPIKVPERLSATPPPRPADAPPYIIDILTQRATSFATQFAARSTASVGGITSIEREDASEVIQQLLLSRQTALSEYELFTMAFRIALKHRLDHSAFFSYINCGALTTAQKYSVSFALSLSRDEHAALWNSLLRSDLLGPKDLYQRSLHQPFSLQRFYSSKIQGMGPFFGYLQMAIQDFARKVLILKTDDHFVLAIFIRGTVAWDEDAEVAENVVVCAFLPRSTSSFSTYRPCAAGYRLYCGHSNLQLFDRQRANSFVFMTIPPRASGAEIAISVALQKISDKVRQNIGRVNREPVTGIEIHVVSNRDTVSQTFFDLWFEHVPTENRVRRFDREVRPYRMNDIKDLQWDGTETDRPAVFIRNLFETRLSKSEFIQRLEHTLASQWEQIVQFAIKYHLEDQVFWLFDHVISRPLPLSRDSVASLMDIHPPLVYALLKKFPPDEETQTLASDVRGVQENIFVTLVRAANDFPLPTLVALEKASTTIAELKAEVYLNLLRIVPLSIRASQLVQEVLLVLNDCRSKASNLPPVMRYLHRNALAVAFERAEEAADECPCNEDGRPRKQRTSPVKTNLTGVPDKPARFVKAVLRVDARTPIRIHSHVRLQSASPLEYNASNPVDDKPIVLDATVVETVKGEVMLDVFQPLPPEFEIMDWTMYHAGSIATSSAMMDALGRLVREKEECCGYYRLLVGDSQSSGEDLAGVHHVEAPFEYSSGLNESQKRAIDSCDAILSLIWGPPGTGKTTVVVQILCKLIQTNPDARILMTASTHNAVDNVLERFIKANDERKLLREDQILRVATDASKVNKDLTSYTVDARVGGDLTQNRKLQKQAQARVDAANLIFTTCAGAGLGILRDKTDFDITLIDEASQVTEPCALIPLVKGSRRAILVGDHVQLRPTVKNVGKALQSDVSLMERLYRGADVSGITKTMLDTQYRFPQELAAFPSREFYEGKLKSGLQNTTRELKALAEDNRFPWPTNESGVPIPCVFVQCAAEEDMGGLSKSNAGQVEMVANIVKLLRSRTSQLPAEKTLTITILSPYTKQIQELRHRLNDAPAFTIDSFQGRESDIIIFSAVRSNVMHDIGFLEDERRLNVMWTRARRALIIVGNRETMQSNALWKRALDACHEAVLPDSQ